MKNLSFTLLSFVLLTCNQLIAQKKDSISNWKKAIQTGANLNQASFSDNWKGGGSNSYAIGLFLDAKANHEDEILSFANELQLQYGFSKNAGQTERKNTDRIFFDSKLGYKFKPKWDFYFSINFLSQFDIGYKYSKDQYNLDSFYMISKFMSPGYLTSSLGFEYKPVSYIWVRFGAGTIRQTFMLDTTIYHSEPRNYGVPVGKKMGSEVAFMFIFNFDKDLAKNLNLKANFMALAPYGDLQAINTRFDLIFNAKITKFINVNLSGSVLYDQDMDYDIQYCQMIGIGILFDYSEFGK